MSDSPTNYDFANGAGSSGSLFKIAFERGTWSNIVNKLSAPPSMAEATPASNLADGALVLQNYVSIIVIVAISCYIS